jgi:hypothetical protein
MITILKQQAHNRAPLLVQIKEQILLLWRSAKPNKAPAWPFSSPFPLVSASSSPVFTLLLGGRRSFFLFCWWSAGDYFLDARDGL